MMQRWIFPIFNGLVCALMGGLVGYYTCAIPAGALIGGSAGLLVSLTIEWELGWLGLKHWLYQRRVLWFSCTRQAIIMECCLPHPQSLPGRGGRISAG